MMNLWMGALITTKCHGNGHVVGCLYCHKVALGWLESNISTGELVMYSNFKNEDISLRSGLNATEVISYQYLGMTKIAGA
jgi:hypothetical protein